MTLVMVAWVGMPPSNKRRLAGNWIAHASQGHFQTNSTSHWLVSNFYE